MAETSHIKCRKCGVFSTNSDYCKNCGHLISYAKKRELKIEKEKKERIAIEKNKLENPNWVERLKKHPNILFKAIGWVLYSGFLVLTAIGTFIAWIIAMVAAG